MGSPRRPRQRRGEFLDPFQLYAVRKLNRNRWAASLASLVSLVGTAFTVHIAHGSVTYPGPENWAMLAVLFLGVPFLAIQALGLSPLTVHSVGVVRRYRPGRGVHWLSILAVLLPLITLAAVVVGLRDRRPGP